MPGTDQWSQFSDSTGRPLNKKPEVIRPGVNAIIFNDSGEVLLERRSDNDFWGLPGGGVEIGESVEQTAVREAFEETGLKVTVKRLVGIYSDLKNHSVMSYPDGGAVHYISVVFECERRSGELRMSSESTELRYFPAESLPENTLLSHRLRIQDALANRVEPFIR